MELGIFLAFAAALAWGSGDFLLQKGSRIFGEWETIFIIAAFSMVGLTPFVVDQVPSLTTRDIGILLGISCVLLLAAVLQLRALRIGKLSVIEPIFAFEIPIVTLLAGYFFREIPSLIQATLIACVFLGMILISFDRMHHMKQWRTEKGVWLGLFATTCMGAVNFLFGYGAREITPLMVNWFTDLFLFASCGLFLLSTGVLGVLFNKIKKNILLGIGIGIIDNIAWIAYAASMALIPIAIATGISESYIVLTVFLGMVFNKERLHIHQWAGLVLVLVGAVALAGSLEL